MNCKSCGAEITLCERCWGVCTDACVVAGIGDKSFICCYDCCDEVQRLDNEWWDEHKKQTLEANKLAWQH